jgi:hypothetical protein
MPTTYEPQLKRIVSRFVEQHNGCWHHPSTPTAKGYAQTKFGWPIAKSTLIHRLSWMYYKGDIAEDMVLDHLCHDPAVCEGGNTCEHRRCVNPNHLQLVSASDNSKKTVRILEFKTHCVNGHSLKNNVYVYSNGKRKGCATCMNRKVAV